ncbi:MAG: T9SS type A sorting domain-containing protein [bacterium]
MFGSSGGGIYAFLGASCVGKNNIVYGNTAWQEPEFSGTLSFNYNCVPGLTGGNGNIGGNPRFVNPALDDYNLQANSPCIDTGDPLSPPDPDGTRCDMGAMFYDQGGSYPEFVVNMTYVSGSPVPLTGGQLIFDIYVLNDSGEPQNYDAWLASEFEGGNPTTLVMRSFTNFQSGWAINRPGMFYPVSGAWAAGNYEFFARCGDEPGIVWQEDSFPFTKSGLSDGRDFVPFPVAGAPNPFDRIDEGASTTPSEFLVTGAYPNPFNPMTTISFGLPSASLVKLEVYDLQGRTVATLMNGWREAGSHEAIFHAAELSSGVYLYHLQAGEHRSIGKMMLMK